MKETLPSVRRDTYARIKSGGGSMIGDTVVYIFFFFFSSRRRHTRFKCDWSSDVCSSDLFAGDELGMEELDPLAVGGLGNLTGIAAVAGEEVEVLGKVEVNRPLIALHVVRDAAVGVEVVADEEEVFALGVLPVVPDGLAVEPPEL